MLTAAPESLGSTGQPILSALRLDCIKAPPPPPPTAALPTLVLSHLDYCNSLLSCSLTVCAQHRCQSVPSKSSIIA